MSSDYERLLRDYQIPPGALTPEELRLLEQGGIRLDDSDDEQDYSRSYNINRQTKPRVPNMAGTATAENEAFKQIYENELSKKDKQIWYLQNENAHREKIWEAERGRI